MNILIVGAGCVGESMAEALESEKSDTADTNTDRECLALLQNRFDLRGVAGNGILPSTLREAGGRRLGTC